MVKKKRKGFFDDLFGDFFDDFFDIPLDEFGGGATGYSIEVHTTPEGTEVHAHVYGNVDKKSLKRKLESMYPGAKIVIEGEGGEEHEEEPLIRRIDEGKGEVPRGKKTKESSMSGARVSISFDKGKPIIRRISESEIRVEKREELGQEKKENEKHKEKNDSSAVRIIFKKGKPIIKRIDE